MQTTLRHCPPWTLRAWPPILWQVGRPSPVRLQHWSTQVTQAGDATSGPLGQTLWAWKGDEGAVGVAWDWVQLHGGVVAMADPMAVLTNLRLVGDAGEMLTPYESARHFNAIVHALPWQDVVEQALEQALAAGAGTAVQAAGTRDTTSTARLAA